MFVVASIVDGAHVGLCVCPSWRLRASVHSCAILRSSAHARARNVCLMCAFLRIHTRGLTGRLDEQRHRRLDRVRYARRHQRGRQRHWAVHEHRRRTESISAAASCASSLASGFLSLCERLQRGVHWCTAALCLSGTCFMSTCSAAVVLRRSLLDLAWCCALRVSPPSLVMACGLAPRPAPARHRLLPLRQLRPRVPRPRPPRPLLHHRHSVLLHHRGCGLRGAGARGARRISRAACRMSHPLSLWGGAVESGAVSLGSGAGVRPGEGLSGAWGRATAGSSQIAADETEKTLRQQFLFAQAILWGLSWLNMLETARARLPARDGAGSAAGLLGTRACGAGWGDSVRRSERRRCGLAAGSGRHVAPPSARGFALCGERPVPNVVAWRSVRTRRRLPSLTPRPTRAASVRKAPEPLARTHDESARRGLCPTPILCNNLGGKTNTIFWFRAPSGPTPHKSQSQGRPSTKPRRSARTKRWPSCSPRTGGNCVAGFAMMCSSGRSVLTSPFLVV